MRTRFSCLIALSAAFTTICDAADSGPASFDMREGHINAIGDLRGPGYRKTQ